MHPVLIHIGRFSVYSWGFMLAVAVVVGILGVSRIARQQGYDTEMILDLILVAVVGGLLGARLFHVVVYEWAYFVDNPLIFFSLSEGGFRGLIWYGGFVGGVIPCIIYIRKKQLSFWNLADMFIPYLAFGYALVRVGCFLNGCCYGDVTGCPFGVVFPGVDEYTRHPTQLYSSMANLIFFAGLLWFYPRRKFSGQVFLLYLLVYPVYRFSVEFFRYSSFYWGPFTLGQICSLFLFVAAAVLYFWRLRYSSGEIYVRRG